MTRAAAVRAAHREHRPMRVPPDASTDCREYRSTRVPPDTRTAGRAYGPTRVPLDTRTPRCACRSTCAPCAEPGSTARHGPPAPLRHPCDPPGCSRVSCAPAVAHRRAVQTQARRGSPAVVAGGGERVAPAPVMALRGEYRPPSGSAPGGLAGPAGRCRPCRVKQRQPARAGLMRRVGPPTGARSGATSALAFGRTLQALQGPRQPLADL
jgi:hypothetical protein